MRRTFLAIGLALMLGASVQAKTPKEVLEPYKAYRTALENNDDTLAAQKAFEAWELAEELMGETKTTGDLAANFAELQPTYMNNKLAWERVVKAHKRSVDMAPLYTEDAKAVEVDRRIKLISYLLANVSRSNKSAWNKKYGPKRLNERLKEFGMEGSTFDAESLAFSARIALMEEDWVDAETHSKAAMELFETRTDGIVSAYEYAVPIYLARAHVKQKRPVDAALTYQALMTKLETQGGHKNAISADAYGEWIRLRDGIISEKNTDPRAPQVVNFIVPAGRTADLAPLIRKPPVIPAGFLRGSNSGFVKVKFNVDINGRVVDPIILSSTNKSLHDATLESLKGWRYTPNLPEARSKDVNTTIKFDIIGRKGKRLPDGKEKNRL